MKKNRIRICGRKVITAPTPAIAPSTSKERNSPGGSALDNAMRQPGDTRPRSRRPASALHANTAWNMTNMIAARMSGPSDRVEQDAVEPVGPAPDRRFADHRRGRDFARAPLEMDDVALDRRLRPRSAAPSSMSLRAPASKFGDAAAADGDGFDHRNAQRLLERGRASSSSPSRRARSTMLSATTVGSPSSSSCSAKRR